MGGARVTGRESHEELGWVEKRLSRTRSRRGSQSVTSFPVVLCVRRGTKRVPGVLQRVVLSLYSSKMTRSAIVSSCFWRFGQSIWTRYYFRLVCQFVPPPSGGWSCPATSLSQDLSRPSRRGCSSAWQSGTSRGHS